MQVTNVTAGPIKLGDGSVTAAGETRDYAVAKLTDRDQRRVDRAELAVTATPKADTTTPASTDDAKGKSK
jgi:hypothetical protein